VRIPRGRATVKIVASEATMQKPGDLPGRSLQLSNASRKGVQAAVEILFSEKIPSPACRFCVAERVMGFCLFGPGIKKILCAISVALCVSVVIISRGKFTTEAQKSTEPAQSESLVVPSLVTPSLRSYF
jgi:hypothetical protein